MTVRKVAILASLWLSLSAQSPQATGEAEPKLSMWRLECGTFAYEQAQSLPWNRTRMPVPCFLIRHGSQYMLWDAGFAAAALKAKKDDPQHLATTIVDQLARLGVKPEQISVVGISHYHGDHTGQASFFPKAKLVIGAEDLAALKARPAPTGGDPNHLKPWISGGAPLAALDEDLDIFGDGRVVAITTPGHTPGHLSLIVKLASRTVMLTGDLWGSHGSVMTEDMPDWNWSRAETAASRERFRRLADKNEAMVIIQHEEADQAKLPPFPQAAE